MFKLPAIQVPEFIARLCEQEDHSMDFLIECVSEDQYILNLIYQSYSEQLERKNIREFFNGLGYPHAVLMISSIYVQKSVLRTNPGSVMPEVSRKLISFFDQAEQYSENIHRIIILTTYLGLADGEMRSVYKNNKADFLKFKPVVKTLLSAMKEKVEHIDIFYMLVMLLDDIESLENIQKFFVDGRTFINLYKTFSESQRNDLIQNLLIYGQSVNEYNFFTKEIELA